MAFGIRAKLLSIVGWSLHGQTLVYRSSFHCAHAFQHNLLIPDKLQTTQSTEVDHKLGKGSSLSLLSSALLHSPHRPIIPLVSLKMLSPALGQVSHGIPV